MHILVAERHDRHRQRRAQPRVHALPVRRREHVAAARALDELVPVRVLAVVGRAAPRERVAVDPVPAEVAPQQAVQPKIDPALTTEGTHVCRRHL